MRVLEVLPRLFFFERGYLNGNHFAAREPDVVLLDTGYASGLEQTLACLSQVGIDHADVQRIVNTHCHCDHVGGNPAIQGASGSLAQVHCAARPMVESGNRVATWWDYYHQEGEFFPVGGWLEDGEEIQLGGHPFRVLHLPGHAPDQIALFHSGEKLLISSDALWERDLAVVTAAVEGDDAAAVWLASLDRLADLEVKLVLPGHGTPFADFTGALERTRERLQGYCKDPLRMAEDLLRKITVYTLLMNGPQEEAGFFDRLQATRWFPETVDRWFGGARRIKYDETLASLLQRGAAVRAGGNLATQVRP